MKHITKDMEKIYLEKILQYSLLDFDEELALARKIQAGDVKAEKTLVNSNLRLVVSIAKKLEVSGDLFMDAIQEGNLGLVIAARRYNPSFNVRFSTYAYSWIMQYMLKFLREKTSLVSVPVRVRQLVSTIEKVKNHLFAQNGRMPCVQEIADFSGIEKSKIDKVMQSYQSEVSIFSTISDTEDLTLADTIKSSLPTPEEAVMTKACKKEVKKMVSELPLFEKRVVFYSFGFSSKKQSLREIAKRSNCSPETVRITKMRALGRMRHSIAHSLERSAVLTV
ncbi:MAG: sigma-70 family RNA polymerase sigma factor [Treponema sp.]|nr:sigma-70 family RNA polymerase sigma factor [Treponema sp.]